MRRAVALTLVFLALGAGVAALAGEVAPTERAPLRFGVLFGLPLLVGLLGAALVARPPVPPPAGRRAALLAAALVVVDQAPIGLGFLLHQLTFTFGDQTLAAGRLLVVVAGLPLVAAVYVWGWERGLRERLWSGAAAAGWPRAGAAMSVGCGIALSLVGFAPGFGLSDAGFALAAGGATGLREATALRLYRGGGLFASGLYRGLLAGLEGLVIADWSSFWFPSANFVSSEPSFAWLRLLGPAAALAAALVLARPARASAAG